MNNRDSGFSLLTILFIIFLVLKLVGTITWSWWWVFSPLIANVVIAILAFIVIYSKRKSR